MSAESWLEHFAACVRARDFGAARQLFDQDSYSYGTRMDHGRTVDELVNRQWMPVWNATTDFTFTDHQIVVRAEEVSVIAARWSSFAATDRRLRTGRSTLVLSPAPETHHGWRCIHTHFSLTPEPRGPLAGDAAGLGRHDRSVSR